MHQALRLLQLSDGICGKWGNTGFAWGGPRSCVWLNKDGVPDADSRDWLFMLRAPDDYASPLGSFYRSWWMTYCHFEMRSCSEDERVLHNVQLLLEGAFRDDDVLT